MDSREVPQLRNAGISQASNFAQSLATDHICAEVSQFYGRHLLSAWAFGSALISTLEGHPAASTIAAALSPPSGHCLRGNRISLTRGG